MHQEKQILKKTKLLEETKINIIQKSIKFSSELLMCIYLLLFFFAY